MIHRMPRGRARGFKTRGSGAAHELIGASARGGSAPRASCPPRRRARRPSPHAALRRHHRGHDAGGDLVVLRPDHPGPSASAGPPRRSRASACASRPTGWRSSPHGTSPRTSRRLPSRAIASVFAAPESMMLGTSATRRRRSFGCGLRTCRSSGAGSTAPRCAPSALEGTARGRRRPRRRFRRRSSPGCRRSTRPGFQAVRSCCPGRPRRTRRWRGSSATCWRRG